MQDWLFDAGYEPAQPEAMGAGPVADGPSLSALLGEVQAHRALGREEALTLPSAPESLSPDTQDWIVAFKASATNDTYLPLFGAGDPGNGDGSGTRVDDIIVVGERPRNDDDPYDEWWETGGLPGGEGPDPGMGGGDGWGGGGGDAVDPTQRDYNACEDRQADTLAADINDEIRNQPDSDRREYGALIWRDDEGNLHRTALVPGTNGEVPYPADPNELGLDSYSRVVGMVHSHPSWVLLPSGWVPASHGWMHPGDLIAADRWVSQNDLDADNFTIYVSFEGQVREYDYFDNRDENIRLLTNYTSEGSEESGDYNPGETCP